MLVEVGPLDEFEPGSVTTVRVGSAEIAVFNAEGCLYALDSECAHRGGPLAEGRVADGIVTCPRHWWRYRLDTGQRLGSSEISLETYQVLVEEGTVFVDAPHGPEQPASMRDRLLRHAEQWSREG